ncbi:hypothetical protein AS026_33020 [Rhizobium altiplani]|uniref:Uncharacterized protein n=1 Tax=Rhizobium altiplani TaxID=1864509 RepID=A0A109JX22_9HYPH|nr:hypothetical protein AS026_33020 [Rhizobium altiplani]
MRLNGHAFKPEDGPRHFAAGDRAPSHRQHTVVGTEYEVVAALYAMHEQKVVELLDGNRLRVL